MLHILISDSSLNQSLTFHQTRPYCIYIVLRFLTWRILILEHNQLVDLGEQTIFGQPKRTIRMVRISGWQPATAATVPKEDDLTNTSKWIEWGLECKLGVFENGVYGYTPKVMALQ